MRGEFDGAFRQKRRGLLSEVIVGRFSESVDQVADHVQIGVFDRGIVVVVANGMFEHHVQVLIGQAGASQRRIQGGAFVLRSIVLRGREGFRAYAGISEHCFDGQRKTGLFEGVE